MKYFLTKQALQGLLLIVLSILAPILAFIPSFLVRWDKEESVGPQRTNPPTPTIMGDLPWWLSWFETPDQRLPCDTGISECKAYLDKYGKRRTAWMWMGLRNQFMGLACDMGLDTDGYIPEDIEGYWERNDKFGHVWCYRKTIGKYKWYVGYTSYAMLDGTFRAAPRITVKR